jgi:hypothetical protein
VCACVKKPTAKVGARESWLVFLGALLDMERPIFLESLNMAELIKVMDKPGRKRVSAAKTPAKPTPLPDPMSRKQQVQALLSKMDSSLDLKAEKASVADFIRLTQLERELEQNEPVRKVVVTWKEPPGIQLIET